ncbi:MAG: response regulator transcription factor [Lachnospiraceae bacterium]|nr:response regulator transcription factor [Lachnospiraceae bacterium]
MKNNILVVDDDVYIGNMMEEMLTREGYGVMRAYSGTEAALLIENVKKPDLILLDLMLPGLSGEELLAKLDGVPVIVVSAKNDTDDKVQLLLGGAADYITKPFEGKELLARVAVQLRRKDVNAGNMPSELKFEDIVMSVSAHEVTVGEQPVKLTKTEYAILKILMQNPSQVVTKSVILDRISEDTPDCMESSLKVHVSNLRRKLREVSGREYIEAVWGIGFKMKE